MKVCELAEKLSLTSFIGETGLDNEVASGYAGDLLSCVMGSAPAGAIWVTVQGHVNIVAVALLRDLSAILISEGGLPDADTKRKAEEEGIALLGTECGTFEMVCRLYENGVMGTIGD